MAEVANDEVRRAQNWLGTLVEIRAGGAARNALDDGVAAGFAAIAAIHRALSGHAADSELAALNRHAAHAPQRVSEHLRRVLACALDLARASAGVFDPTVGGALSALGYLPPPREPPAPASWRDVELRDGRVRFARPLTLDFDGIAKGYAVDCAMTAMRARGIAHGCVNAGGDLRVWGAAAETVHVRTGGPQGALLPLATLGDAAVATSAYGGQRRSSGGRYATPLIDPRSALPVMSTRTVSVIAPTCMVADALTKVVALSGARAARLVAAYGASAAILTPTRGRWRCTTLPRRAA